MLEKTLYKKNSNFGDIIFPVGQLPPMLSKNRSFAFNYQIKRFDVLKCYQPARSIFLIHSSSRARIATTVAQKHYVIKLQIYSERYSDKVTE